VLKLVLLILPLGLDTFAVSAALGARGLPARERLRVSLLLSGFELAMPIIGLLLGRALGHVVGSNADWLAIGVLTLLGIWMLLEEEDESDKAGQLPAGRGLALFALGLSISLDELAIGFTIGLLQLSLWVAVAVIGVQAFLFAQLGLRLGTRLNESFRERAEKAAGLVLVGLAALLAVEKLT
jgi:putative Mn2+ efflux pump MntP